MANIDIAIAGGISTQLLGAIKMRRNSEIIIHTAAAATVEGAGHDQLLLFGPQFSILCDLFYE